MEGSQTAAARSAPGGATATAAAASGAPNAAAGEPEWRVRIFRKTLSNGWESLNGTISQKDKTKKKKKIAWFRASPRGGCIVVRRLRLRVSICKDTVVTRRGDTRIMIRPKQGIRVLVLVFATADDCRSFSDRFVALNPHHHEGAPVVAAVSVAAVSGTSPVAPPMMATPAARAITPTTQNRISNSNIHGADSDDNNNQNAGAVMAYIARLLQDKDFADYVQSLESTLMNSQDGAKMLQDLVVAQQDDSSSLLYQEEDGDEEDDE